MEFIIAGATVFGVTVVPLGSLLWGLHVINVRSRAMMEQRQFDAARSIEKKRRRQERRLNRRLDHLDDCIDGVRTRVQSIEGHMAGRRASDRPAAAQ